MESIMGGASSSAVGVESLFPGDRGRSHLRQAASKTYEFKPSLRPLEPYKASHEAKYGMKHVTETSYKLEARALHGGAPLQRPELRHGYDMSTRSGYDIPDPPVHWQGMKRAEWVGKDYNSTGGGKTAADARYYISSERILEKECGMKMRVPTNRDKRNGIPQKNPGDKLYNYVEYSPDYFGNGHPSMQTVTNFGTQGRSRRTAGGGDVFPGDGTGSGVNFRPQPTHEMKQAARVKAAEVADVANLDEGGAADSDDEGGF